MKFLFINKKPSNLNRNEDKFKNISLSFLFIILISFSSCEFLTNLFGCEEGDPDLTADLLDVAGGVIKANQNNDWNYAIEALENAGEKCDALKATASVAGILVDYFENQSSSNIVEILNEEQDIEELNEGQKKEKIFRVSFNKKGIYMPSIKADKTGVVNERNEDNNFASGQIQYLEVSNYFKNASTQFISKLGTAAAIVIVGDLGFDESVKSYMGKRIYYVKI